MTHLAARAPLLCCLLVLAGCGGALSVVPDGRVSLTPTEGFLVFATDSEARLESVSICPEGSFGGCTTVGPFAPPSGLAVIRAPEGRYCVVTTTVHFSAVSGVTHTPDDPPCAEVRAGRLSYPGHYVLRTQATQAAIERVGAGWDPRPDVIEATLRRERPNLRLDYELWQPGSLPE